MLYLRSVAACGIADIQETVIQRLERLAADGVLDSVEIEVWGDGIPTVETSKSDLQATYDEFAGWAHQHGYSLAPAFTVRKTGSMVSEKTKDMISFPLLCLAVYEGDDVQAVFPCTNDTEVYTVEDGLDMLEHRPATVLSLRDERSRVLEA